ncbi:DMT family transporter [Plebeiibacterium sediminum]|uniref:DMT family transporter n=1 Tax=Plebeiibacterium sediminum TaxID=2992112 RepID=A0AAE3M6E0_9BACT|nr:DMT family transporter [Plebeiobacterium sediminum]MCW3788039.1 DMT family transporter [Plebeiobacterium sediminum]
MSTTKGYLLIAGSVISFSIMSALVKSIPEINSTITTFVRFTVGFGILGLLALTKKIKLTFNNSFLLLLRGLTGGFAVFLLYYSIVNIGVGKATVFVYSYPIFATLLSVIIFKEKVKPIQWFFILIAFIGIILLSIKNGLDISQISSNELLAITGGVLSAISVILVKKLHHTDSSTSIFFSQSLIGFWLFMFPANTVSFEGNVNIAIILIAIGIVSAIGQLIMTEGYKYVEVSKGSTMYMLIPVFNIITGYYLFNEVLTFKEWIGALLVIIGCIGVVSTKALKFKFFGPR